LLLLLLLTATLLIFLLLHELAAQTPYVNRSEGLVCLRTAQIAIHDAFALLGHRGKEVPRLHLRVVHVQVSRFGYDSRGAVVHDALELVLEVVQVVIYRLVLLIFSF
jgi:hypothetical protein